jgi:hypothetical protein
VEIQSSLFINSGYSRIGSTSIALDSTEPERAIYSTVCSRLRTWKIACPARSVTPDSEVADPSAAVPTRVTAAPGISSWFRLKIFPVKVCLAPTRPSLKSSGSRMSVVASGNSEPSDPLELSTIDAYSEYSGQRGLDTVTEAVSWRTAR